MNGLHPSGVLRASTALMLCCAMLLLGAAGGYSLGSRERVNIDAPAEAALPPEAAQADPTEAAEPPVGEAEVAQMGEETVSPDAVVTWRYQMACGHIVELTDAQPIIGKTRLELEAAYGAGAVEAFSPRVVTLCLQSDRFCPEHYVLLLEDEALTVRKTNETLDVEVLLTLDVELPPDAAEECAEGLPFDSLEDINIYLEGIEG